MPNLAVQRLHSQRLEGTRLEGPGEVVAWLGALQAQDYAGAKWSVGLRLLDATYAGVEQAISENDFVRTWAVRGTLHFVAATDVRWLLALLAPRLIARNARRYAELELDERTLARSNAVLAGALRGGNRYDRRELLAILERNGISTRGQRAAYMLQRASLDGLICQGVVRGNNPTLMSLDESLPAARVMAHDEALAELARRYFTSRGPATLQDFVWWSGLTTADARAGLKAITADLVRETIDGRTYWMSRSTTPAQNSSPAVHLLPGFDEYLLGYRDRGASLDAAYAKKLNAGGGMLTPTIVADGRVVGTWRRALRKDAVAIKVSPFVPLSEPQWGALKTAAESYGGFVGMPATIVS